MVMISFALTYPNKGVNFIYKQVSENDMLTSMKKNEIKIYNGPDIIPAFLIHDCAHVLSYLSPYDCF